MDYSDLIKFCFFNNINNVQDAIGNLNFMESIGMIGSYIPPNGLYIKNAYDIVKKNYNVNVNLGFKETKTFNYIFNGSSFQEYTRNILIPLSIPIFNTKNYSLFQLSFSTLVNDNPPSTNNNYPATSVFLTDNIYESTTTTAQGIYLMAYENNTWLNFVPSYPNYMKSLYFSTGFHGIGYSYKGDIYDNLFNQNQYPNQIGNTLTRYTLFLNTNNNKVYIHCNYNNIELTNEYVFPFDANPSSPLYGFDVHNSYLNFCISYAKNRTPIQSDSNYNFKLYIRYLDTDSLSINIVNWLKSISI